MNKDAEAWFNLYMKYMEPIQREGKDEFIKWLKNDTDYFTAPASGKYHCNYKHGLIEHSMNVLNYARNLYVFSKKNYPDTFPEISGDSIILSALHHDLCKVNFYGKQKAWTKHEYTWVEYEVYKAGASDKTINIGHGEKSVILMLKNGLTDLTNEEMMAIRYHMGRTNNDIDSEISMKEPLVYLIHMADSCTGLVEETIDYKELALQNHIKKITGK